MSEHLFPYMTEVEYTIVRPGFCKIILHKEVLEKTYALEVEYESEKLAMKVRREWDIHFKIKRSSITYIGKAYNSLEEYWTVSVYCNDSLQDCTIIKEKEDAVRWYDTLTNWWLN